MRDDGPSTDDGMVTDGDAFEHNGPGTNKNVLTDEDGFDQDGGVNARQRKRMCIMVHDEDTAADHAAPSDTNFLPSTERAAGESDVIVNMNDSIICEQGKNDGLT